MSLLIENQNSVDYLLVRTDQINPYAQPHTPYPETSMLSSNDFAPSRAGSSELIVRGNLRTVVFRWKDCRIKRGDRMKVMRLDTHEFLRRFLIHVLPGGFHRIRHYGLLASATRKSNLARTRTLLGAQPAMQQDASTADVIPMTLREPCPDCGGQMRIIETFRRGELPRSRAPPRRQAA